MGEPLKLVERFDELRTGVRVVVKGCSGSDCGGKHAGILGTLETRVWRDVGGGRGVGPMFQVDGGGFHLGMPVGISAETVIECKVYRFAADLGIDDQLALELSDEGPEGGNPYLSRAVVGTGGRDEIRVPARERTR